MSFKLTLRASRVVPAPRSLVWQVFSDLTAWPTWNPLSRGGQRASGLAAGQRLDLWLMPLGLPLKVRATVLKALEGQEVAWRGGAWGVTTTHRYVFSDKGAATLVDFSESLEGWPLLWARPFYSPERLSTQAQAWLASLEDEAQRRAPQGPQAGGLKRRV